MHKGGGKNDRKSSMILGVYFPAIFTGMHLKVQTATECSQTVNACV